MIELKKKVKIKPPRVKLTDEIFDRFFKNIYKGSVTDLRKRTGLPYRLIYNIVHRRVKSISAREYRLIFGEVPPVQLFEKVDGTYFRHLVELWVYLNDNTTKSDIYREVFGLKATRRVDYRIFSGRTQNIDIRLVTLMEDKFFSYGLDRKTVQSWIAELADKKKDDRIPYSRIEPILQFLKEVADIHPSSILNQYVERYKSRKLKSVSRKVYDRAVSLKKKLEESLESKNRFEIEKVKEDVYGSKKGYTLYAEIEEELKFLQKFARKSPKRYLGRSTTVYERQGCKRIASERADRIQGDCDLFIRRNPQLKLAVLPKSHQQKWLNLLLNILKGRVTDLLFQSEGIDFEKHILTPLHSKNEYEKPQNGFTQFDLASRALGIKKKVFDLMVATNCEIFKMVGRYDNRWYLSDLYLKELSQKKYFDLIAAKYEFLAEKNELFLDGGVCMQ